MSCLSENCIFKSLALKTNALIAISLFLLSLSAAVNASEPQSAKQEQAIQHDAVQWLDYEDARALKSSKPIFVFAEMTFCSACKKMRNEVFVQQDIIDTLNNQFIPANMSTLGIFPNSFDDLLDPDGGTLSLAGSPGFVIIQDQQYSVFYGFQSAQRLRKVLAMVTQSAP